jgi:hypothetical protein
VRTTSFRQICGIGFKAKDEVKTSFCEQKEAKKLCPAGCGDSRANARSDQSFLVLFFKKEPLSYVSK